MKRTRMLPLPVLAALVLCASAALAQAPAPPDAASGVVGALTLPRDLSPWGMFLNADPLVKAVLARFPGAQIVAVREGEQEMPATSSEGDVMPPEPPIDDDSSVFAEQIGPDDIRDDD